jgi:hypothetical protein
MWLSSRVDTTNILFPQIPCHFQEQLLLYKGDASLSKTTPNLPNTPVYTRHPSETYPSFFFLTIPTKTYHQPMVISPPLDPDHRRLSNIMPGAHLDVWLCRKSGASGFLVHFLALKRACCTIFLVQCLTPHPTHFTKSRY